MATIKRLERGAAVYLDTARRLATALAVPFEELLLPNETATEVLAGSRAPATVAVLRFEVVGTDDGSRCFADGLVEDIITRLGRQWFPVIARSSSFSYRGETPEPRTIRAELGADYCIEGSVRRSGDTVRVTARLTDTHTSRQVWANSYDRSLAEVFAVQDAIVSTIVSQASGALVQKEYHGLHRRDPGDLTGWELALRGNWHFHLRTIDGNREARSLFEQALRREPMLPLAWYFLALTHQRAIVNQWSDDPGSSLRELQRICADFSRWHPSDAGLRIATAYAAIYSGDRLAAVGNLREAIEIDPNATTAYSLYGQAMAMDNAPEEAIEQFELALRLSPRDSELWSLQTAIALCHFVTESYQDMLRWAQLAIRSRPDMPFPYGTMAVARAFLDDLDGARLAGQTMCKLEPRTSVRGLQAIVASTNPDIVERYLSGLRQAGVPE